MNALEKYEQTCIQHELNEFLYRIALVNRYALGEKMSERYYVDDHHYEDRPGYIVRSAQKYIDKHEELLEGCFMKTTIQMLKPGDKVYLGNGKSVTITGFLPGTFNHRGIAAVTDENKSYVTEGKNTDEIFITLI